MAGLDITDSEETFLRSCIAVVQKHISDIDFDLAAFANEVHTSKSSLYKRLKAASGVTTTTFIRTIRMKTAAEILDKDPGIRISELAYKVGYNDPKYFSSCFKQDYGMLPSEYVKHLTDASVSGKSDDGKQSE